MTNFNELPIDELRRVDERTMAEPEIERTPARHRMTVFGYACRQTPALMPLPIWLAHRLARHLAAARRVIIMPPRCCIGWWSIRCRARRLPQELVGDRPEDRRLSDVRRPTRAGAITGVRFG
jgi:hypothetical protein